MVKGGKEGIRIAPEQIRPISAIRTPQEVEWRCLSFREVRVVATEEGNDEENAIGSSGTEEYAEQDCAASLEKEMMTLFAPLRWHTELRVVVVVDDEGLTWRAIEGRKHATRGLTVTCVRQGLKIEKNRRARIMAQK
jgi:hypothetical protein